MRRVEPEPAATLAAPVSSWETGAVEADFSPSKAEGYHPYRTPAPTWPSWPVPRRLQSFPTEPSPGGGAVISPD